MTRFDMTAQHFPTPPAIQAHDVLGADRLPDRDCWVSLWLRLGCCPDRQQRLIDRVDERRYVGWRDLVLADVSADDLSDQ